MKAKTAVLLAGPFPPPNGGVSAINKLIFDGIDNYSYKIVLLDSSRFKRKINIESSTGIFNLFFQFIEIITFIYFSFRHNCRIIHISLSSYHSFYKGAVFTIIAAALGRKVILHLHGGAFNLFYEARNSVIKRFIRYIFRKCDRVIVLSKYWKHFIIEKIRLEPKQVVILYNSYGLEFEKLEKSLVKLHSKRNKDKITILYIGALSVKKGVQDLIDICVQLIQRSKNFKLVIAGAEKERHFLAKADYAIRHNQLTEYVELPGEIQGERKLEAFLSSDIFILPSYIENSPISIIEAMRAGLSVISTPIGAIPEIIRDGENGFLVKPGHISEFAEKILLLSMNDTLKNQIEQNNLNKALAFYNPKSYSMNLVKIYNQIIEKNY